MNKDRFSAYRPLIRLTLPIVVQNLLSALVSSADVVMLSSVGQSAISAVSLASQYSSILFSVFYGLSSGVSILAAQYWGRKDIRAIELVEGIALRFSVATAAVFFLACQLAPGTLMLLFTSDPELIEIGIGYLRAASWSFLFWSVTEVYLAALRSVGRVTISTFLNTLALGLNIALNAVFVYGLFGAPKLGVYGVGLATSIARGVAMAASLLVSLRSRDVKLRPRAVFERNQVLLRDFIRMAVPALGNDVSWGVAFSLYSAILGHMGSDIVSANAIVTVVRNFATVMCYALGNSALIRIGPLIGADRPEEARAEAKRYIRLTVAAGALGGLLVLACLPFAGIYASDYAHLTETATGYLRVMLLINTYYVMGTAVNTLLIVGFFRAGGDSRFGFICDTIDMWCYALPLGVLAAFVLKLPPLWVYFLLCTDEFVKWPWVIGHYRKGRWVRNITKSYE